MHWPMQTCSYLAKGAWVRAGVAFLWRSTLDARIARISVDDDKIIGIRYEVNNGVYLYLFQVISPCTNHPFELFKHYIEKLFDITSPYKDKGTSHIAR